MILTNLEEKIKRILGYHPITNDEIETIEKALSIQIPALFIKLNSYCSYEYCSIVAFFNFGSFGNYSVIESTKSLYELYPTSKQYLHLYSDDNSIILMELNSNASVLWCSIYDFENFLKDQSFEMQYDYYPSFKDFFEYLLDEEEKIRFEEDSAV